jgi:hypothetical protein
MNAAENLVRITSRKITVSSVSRGKIAFA